MRSLTLCHLVSKPNLPQAKVYSDCRGLSHPRAAEGLYFAFIIHQLENITYTHTFAIFSFPSLQCWAYDNHQLSVHLRGTVCHCSKLAPVKEREPSLSTSPSSELEKKRWRQVCLAHNFVALGLAQVSKATVLIFSRVLTQCLALTKM